MVAGEPVVFADLFASAGVLAYPIAVARLLGRAGDLAAALAGS